MDSSQIIFEIFRMLRHGSGMPDVIPYTLQCLAENLKASRCTAWLVSGVELEALYEFSTDGQSIFKGKLLDAQQTMPFVLEFLVRFPNETNIGAIAISDPSAAPDSIELVKRMEANFGISEPGARLFGQLRSKGIFSGFLDIQRAVHIGEWSEAELQFFEEILLVLSVLVQQSFDIGKITADVYDYKLMYEIACIFGKQIDAEEQWKQATSLIASQFGFEKFQIYLKGGEEQAGLLIPQVEGQMGEVLNLAEPPNEIMDVFRNKRGKLIKRSEDDRNAMFVGESAILLPMMRDDNSEGVLCLWQSRGDQSRWTPQKSERCNMLAGLLADYAAAIEN